MKLDSESRLIRVAHNLNRVAKTNLFGAMFRRMLDSSEAAPAWAATQLPCCFANPAKVMF